ncbi:helix-turn-helix domain-containing protein [Sphingomonas flavalba]|uniref:helix-turn-helix domain-containing protein n=1 Tax=Sphingomonas flavalba TaxID=2559804 RepID=UPI0039E1DBC4
MSYTLNEAAKATGKSKTTIHRALKSGKISAVKRDNGAYSIEPAELHRVFPAVPAERNEERSNHNDVEHLRNDQGTLRIQLETIEKERERERQQLQETITDLREDRDRWRQQATALLEDKRPRRFWKNLFGN